MCKSLSSLSQKQNYIHCPPLSPPALLHLSFVDSNRVECKRVAFDHTQIGARKSILPKGIKNSMTVEHVGNQNKK